jgi:flagellar biosynthesis protein
MTEEASPQRPPLAVALQYDPETDNAPRVTASGRGVIAEKILETARAHGITIEGNGALAEALSGVELDREIPEELYRAVAEVIGFVLRAAGRLR